MNNCPKCSQPRPVHDTGNNLCPICKFHDGVNSIWKAKLKEKKPNEIKKISKLPLVTWIVFAIGIILFGLFSRGWIVSKTDDPYGIPERIGLRERGTIGLKVALEIEDLSDLASETESTNSLWHYLNIAGHITNILLWIALVTCILTLLSQFTQDIPRSKNTIRSKLKFAVGPLMILSVIVWFSLLPELDESHSLGWTFYIVLVGSILICAVGNVFIPITKRIDGIYKNVIPIDKSKKKLSPKQKTSGPIFFSLIGFLIILLGLFAPGWIFIVLRQAGTSGTFLIDNILGSDFERAGFIPFIILMVAGAFSLLTINFTTNRPHYRKYSIFGAISSFATGSLMFLAIIIWVNSIPIKRGFCFSFYLVIIGGIMQMFLGGYLLPDKKKTVTQEKSELY